jgi:hypothetical protein
MIIIDYNGIAIANIMVQKLAIDENVIRHMILNSIRMYRKRFGKEYGEVVLCSDAGGNWRKELFPQYKASRKKTRAKSSMNWEEVFRITSMVREEIRENFPYKVMHIEGCEADDCIAQLVEETQEFGKAEDVMIISSDKDFAQLQRYNNVKQYSPMQKKFIVEKNPRVVLEEHILQGDTSDGVPNVLSPDNTFTDGLRQTPLRKKLRDLLVEDPHSQGDEIYRNYLRNKKMIDLRECPDTIKTDIINKFDNQDQIGNKAKVFPFLVNKQCRLLLENVQEFIN